MKNLFENDDRKESEIIKSWVFNDHTIKKIYRFINKQDANKIFLACISCDCSIKDEEGILFYGISENLCTDTILESQEKALLSGDLMGINDWQFDSCVFNGDLECESLEEMVDSINKFPFRVINNDNVLNLNIGFKCSGMRSWHVKLRNLKSSESAKNLLTPEQREVFCKDLNLKPVYKQL